MAFKLSLSFKRKPDNDASGPRAPSFHAVNIRCGTDACRAARDEGGTRHLASEAPFLPLAGCDRPSRCECRYQHLDDRRRGPRRQAEGVPPVKPPATDEDLRVSSGRRTEDRDDVVEEEQQPDLLVADTYYGYARSKK